MSEKVNIILEELEGTRAAQVGVYQRAAVEIRALLAERDRLREALKDLVEAVTPEVNEKGACGFLLARLSDARAALKDTNQ